MLRIDWPMRWAPWLTAPQSLDGWRERLETTAVQEAARIAQLQGVAGVGFIGAAGRGNPWPGSDVDLLVMVDGCVAATTGVLREYERQRNVQLLADRVPIEVEAANWVLSREELAGLCSPEGEVQVRAFCEHPRPDMVLKACGGRALLDDTGMVGRYIEGCNHTVFTDRFVHGRLHRALRAEEPRVTAAEELIASGELQAASLELLRAGHGLSTGIYDMWRRIPESIMRAVTKLLLHAEHVGDASTGELFLEVCRLGEKRTWDRFACTPAGARLERDVVLATRRGAGEQVGPLDATRDLLHAVSLLDAWRRKAPAEAYPPWTGVTNDREEVLDQRKAARELLRRLERVRHDLRGTLAGAPT